MSLTHNVRICFVKKGSKSTKVTKVNPNTKLTKFIMSVNNGVDKGMFCVGYRSHKSGWWFC